MKTNTQESRAFTLIELLVVLAILAILVAMSVPTFDRPKAKLPLTKCLSNIKQIGLATQMYLQDNDDRLPASASGGVCAAVSLARYMGVPLDESKKNDDEYVRGICIATPVFRCPAWPKRLSQDKDIGLQYTINMAYYPAGPARLPDLKSGGLLASLSQTALYLELSAHREFTNYSECAVINARTSTFDKNGERNTQENARMIWGGDKRHSGKSTVGFLDGHAAALALTKEEMGYRRIINPLDEQACH